MKILVQALNNNPLIRYFDLMEKQKQHPKNNPPSATSTSLSQQKSLFQELQSKYKSNPVSILSTPACFPPRETTTVQKSKQLSTSSSPSLSSKPPVKETFSMQESEETRKTINQTRPLLFQTKQQLQLYFQTK